MAKPAPMRFEHEIIETIQEDIEAFETAYPGIPYDAMVTAEYADNGGDLTSAKIVVTVVPHSEKAH